MHPYLPSDRPFINRYIQDNPTYRWAKNGGRDHLRLDYGLAITFGINPSQNPSAVLLATYNSKEELDRRGIFANYSNANIGDYFLVLKDETMGRRQTMYMVADNTAANWLLSYIADPTVGSTFYIDRPDYYDDYYTNGATIPLEYRNRNGIYCVKTPMSVAITPAGFKDILNHMSVGDIVKMTSGIPDYVANGSSATPPPIYPPAPPPPFVGSGETDVFIAYEPYALGDCIIFNKKDSTKADYSVYYLSLLENNAAGDWQERWQISTGKTNIHGLYADMIGPKIALIDEAPVEKKLTDVQYKNFIDWLLFDFSTSLPVQPIVPLPGQRSPQYQEFIFADGSRIINDHMSLRYLRLINSGVINYFDANGNLAPWNPTAPTYPLGNAPNVLADLKFEQHIIYDYENNAIGETSLYLNKWVYAITQPGELDPILGSDGLPDFDPSYFVTNAWDLTKWIYRAPKAPKVRGLKYFVQDSQAEAPMMYVFDGFRWWPAGTSVTIPPYNPTAYYVQGDVVEGYMAAKYRDIGAMIQTWGIFKFEWVLDEFGGRRRQWKPINVQCLYDDVSDPANPIEAGLNGAPPVMATIPTPTAPNRDNSFFYINIDPNGPLGRWAHLSGVWQTKQSSPTVVTLSIDDNHIDPSTGVNLDPFAELVNQKLLVNKRNSVDVTYTNLLPSHQTTTFDGTNDCHNFQAYHSYNKYDVFFNYATQAYKIVYESQSKYVSGSQFDPNEYMLEWICLADLHSDWEWKQDPLKDTGLPALNSRMHSQVHVAPKTEWPPEDAGDVHHFWDPVTNTNLYNDPEFMARLDTIYIDPDTWEPYVYRFNQVTGKNEYMPFGGGGKCITLTIPDIHTVPSALNPMAEPDPAHPRWYIQQEVLSGNEISVYLHDPNIGSTVTLKHDIDIGTDPLDILAFNRLKAGDFIWLQASARDMAILVNVTYRDPVTQDITALIVSSMPNANDDNTFEFDLGLLGAQGKALYEDFITREIGSLLTLPVPLFYRVGSILNAQLYLDVDNSFRVVVRVEKHTYEATDPTIVTLIDRYDDMQNYSNVFTLRDGLYNDLAEIFLSMTLNPVTKLFEGFDLNILPLFSTGVPDIEAGTYTVFNPSTSNNRIPDLRLFDKTIIADIITKKLDAYNTVSIPEESIDEGAVSSAIISIDTVGNVTIKVDRTIPGTDSLNGTNTTKPIFITGANPTNNGVTVPLGNNSSKTEQVTKEAGKGMFLKFIGPDFYPTEASDGYNRYQQFSAITLSGGNKAKAASTGSTREEYLQDWGSMTFLPFMADEGPPPTVILSVQNTFQIDNIFFKKTNGDVDIVKYESGPSEYAWGIRLSDKVVFSPDEYEFRIDQTTGKGRLWSLEITDDDPNMVILP